MQTDDTKGTYNVERVKKENAALRKYAAIQRAAEDTIGCQKIYVDLTGGLAEAFVLDELIYFTLPRKGEARSGLRIWKNGVLWMAVSRTEWWERKRLTTKEADGAIERLIKQNLVFKELFLFNKQKTTHLRLNVPEFFRRYLELINQQNPPENQDDTLVKDINDLYEMMGVPNEDTPEGIPNGETGILKREGVSLIGDSFNNPHTTSTQPNGVDTPLPLDWQIAKGGEIVLPNDEQARRVDFANLIALGTSNQAEAYQIALTFQNTRGITMPESKVKGQRKAIKEMLEMGVKALHVKDATTTLIAKGMTVTDLFSVIKTAIDLANKSDYKQDRPEYKPFIFDREGAEYLSENPNPRKR